MISRIHLIFILFICLSSCVTAKRGYYFNNLQPSTEKIDSIYAGILQKIQIGDRLSVIMSTKDIAQNEILNPLGITRNSSGNNSVLGYQVLNDGNVELPIIGLVSVANLSTSEAAALIKEKLSVNYKSPYVFVNLLGRVVVMGSKSPGVVPLYNERLTIFEAIAQSGEMDFSARRDRVWVIREQNGERTSSLLDLTSPQIFQSQYYFLKTNDLVYVEPSRFSSFIGANAPGRLLFFSAVSIAALFFSLTR
jgi:polysaccharide export outer membrane protein